MGEIVLFGGTTEGKLLTEYMERNGIACFVCVATEYGRQSLPAGMEYCQVTVGRMDQGRMERFFRDHEIRLVLDATHPYAVEVTRNIIGACQRTGIRCLRVGRGETSRIDGAMYVPSAQAAAEYLTGREGNVLLTTGSKELACFRSVSGYQNRLYVRILPVEEAVQKAMECGFREDHLLCGKGPFGIEENMKMIADSHARYLVTKDTGVEGGLPQKAEAARRAGIRLLVIRRPAQEAQMDVEEAKLFLQQQYSPPA